MSEKVDTSKLKVPCLVMSRVVGYYSDVKDWGKGKRQEWEERETYNLEKALNHKSKAE